MISTAGRPYIAGRSNYAARNTQAVPGNGSVPAQAGRQRTQPGNPTGGRTRSSGWKRRQRGGGAGAPRSPTPDSCAPSSSVICRIPNRSGGRLSTRRCHETRGIACSGPTPLGSKAGRGRQAQSGKARTGRASALQGEKRGGYLLPPGLVAATTAD